MYGKPHIIGDYVFVLGVDGVVNVYYRRHYINGFMRTDFDTFRADCRDWHSVMVRGKG